MFDDFENSIFEICPNDDLSSSSVMISKELIKDSSVSFECRALIMFLISFENEKDLTINEIVESFSKHHSRSEVEKLIFEGLKSGYIICHGVCKNGIFKFHFRISQTKCLEEGE